MFGENGERISHLKDFQDGERWVQLNRRMRQYYTGEIRKYRRFLSPDIIIVKRNLIVDVKNSYQ